MRRDRPNRYYYKLFFDFLQERVVTFLTIPQSGGCKLFFWESFVLFVQSNWTVQLGKGRDSELDRGAEGKICEPNRGQKHKMGMSPIGLAVIFIAGTDTSLI